MGHLVGKDIYQQLGHRLDQASIRTPWTPIFAQLVASLFSPAEAELVTCLPYRPSTLERIAKMLKQPESQLRPMLDSLCTKGLVMDIWDGQNFLYMVSPMVVGFFEFTMMRTGQDLPLAQWAELFEAYMFGDSEFLHANFGEDQQTSIMRALPHEQALGEHVEILDYEKAASLIEENTEFSLGLCSCRHEKHHLGHAPCPTPMETCTSMGSAAQFLIRNGLAQAIEKSQMREILARSREQGLVLSADNVRTDTGFICHCCACCCNLLRGVRETGYPGILVTASVEAQIDAQLCIGCGLCVKACPVDALALVSRDKKKKQKDKPKVNKLAQVLEHCLGCGVCALKCPTGAIKLHPRAQKVYHPEDSFERVIIQALERDTLQTLFFDNPQSKTQEFMRSLVGGFLKLPAVKRSLLSDRLRSRFLATLRKLSS